MDSFQYSKQYRYAPPLKTWGGNPSIKNLKQTGQLEPPMTLFHMKRTKSQLKESLVLAT